MKNTTQPAAQDVLVGQHLVIFQQIKAQKRDEFMDFVGDVLCPAFARLLPGADCRVKVMEPGAANDDGRYMYVMLVSPAYNHSSQIVPDLLMNVYGEEQGSRYVDAWKELLSNPQVHSLIVDSPDGVD